MIGGKWWWIAAAAGMLLTALVYTTSAQQAGMKLLNPKGQDPSDLVKEVMRKYGIEEGKLAFIGEGRWVYGSETSAVVAVETNLRAQTTLEFGETDAYGKKLDGAGPHYIHVFYLKDLKPDATYHVKVSAVDRTGGKADSGDFTVATRSMNDVVRIPEDMEGPPYELNKPGTTYLVTKDFTAPRSAFNISASGVTLDLGGHIVVYNEEHLGLPTDSFNAQVKDSAFGVRVRGAGEKVKILNGTIRQGKGQDEASYTTLGFNPIYVTGAADSEIAGVTCIYGGTQMSGIIFHWSGVRQKVHHNVVNDLGRRIANRHQQCTALKLASQEDCELYNNLIIRARQGALASAGQNVKVHNNEMHIDSFSINSFGIGVKNNSEVYGNRIFGCGNNAVAIGTTGGCDNVKLHDNYIWLHAHDISDYEKDLNQKDMESSDYSIVSGVRITWGSKGVDYYNNTILVTARDGGKIRGTFFYAEPASKGAVFRDNLVIAICENEKSDGWGAIGGVGTGARGEATPILFQNNTIVSNFANFSMKDSYGTSNNYRFVGNTFVKVGDRKDYATIRSRAGYASRGHVFLDNRFEGGAGYDQAVGLNTETFTVQWTLTVKAPAGATVAIRDKDGAEVFRGEVGADGKLDVPLTQYRLQDAKDIPATPHTVVVTAAGKTAEKSVTMDAKKEIEIAP